MSGGGGGGGGGDGPGWVDLAMSDASLVAELLVRLGHSRPPAPPPLELAWSVRQRRSKPPPRNPAEKKQEEEGEEEEKGGGGGQQPSRASPTTPLSWSGGATSSGCGGADGSEESPPLDTATRSKVSIASASTMSATIAGKRPRKKKTLAELREEESLLLKERRNLRHELSTLRLNFEKERSINQSLKRIKIGMQSQAAIPKQHEQVQAPSCIPLEHAEVATQLQQRFSDIPEVKKVESREMLELPDLNLPLEDGGPDISCAVA
ncbi:transcription activator of gluconeogenesis HCBG_00867 [Syzygium oleosum]|uniref:transcription activator of gluconeogenesis HCBG_00867 n=1 Tax=Syzygium oleosum TaxID=219896 RepID=UPI0024BA4D12|nr:transcription activator of gluconeogenesis HCBG_00867 [Syzygium oleosum]